MPPEPLPFDRKDFLKDRKPSISESSGIAPPRWREPPTTPSQHNNHGSSSSCRWGGGGVLSDFRRPFSGLHGKRIAGGWHTTTAESGNKENNIVSMTSDNQKDLKGVNSTASPNGNSLPINDSLNSLHHLQSVDQHAKNSGGGGFSTTNSQTLQKDNSLGSSLDWKPLKWIRSGSLSSRGCKIIGVDPFNTKSAAQSGNNTLLRSHSEDAATCLTPRTPDDASCHKKPRLGWGEGLAKYEKKKVDPDDILDKDTRGRNVIVDGVSCSEPLLTSPSNGYSDCASPTTPYSFACSSSPGVEDKECTKTVTVVNDTCNHTEGLSSNLENLEVNLSSSVDELLQTDDSSSSFVKSTSMEKLQIWKGEVTKTLEITETEIDSLENELKSLVSSSSSTECNNEETCEPMSVEKTDSSSSEVNGEEDSNDKNSDTTSEEDLDNDDDDDMLSEVSSGGNSTDSEGEDLDNGEEDKLYDLLLSENKIMANNTSDELSRILLPTTHQSTNVSKASDESLIKKRFLMRKRFLKLKERVLTSKFRALHYSWKEDLHSLSVKKNAKSQKKFESSSRLGYSDHQKLSSSNHSRLSSPGGSLSLVPTTETLDYVNKLHSDSRVKVHRNELKMPCLILDRSERTKTRFISDNGLIENPVEIEKQRFIVNPWSEKDKKIFLNNYSLFGKDFKKIASFLKNKTISDCVEFYYKNHKSEIFQTTKKNSKFAKEKSCSSNITNTYLVTSGRRMTVEGGSGGVTSLEVLGAVSEMVAKVDSQQKSNDFAMSCNEQETAAADVLAGICGSISSEALGSCITSSVDHGDVKKYVDQRSVDRSSLSDVDEESSSDDMDCPTWTDSEKLRFIKAFTSYGKDFELISRSMKTKTKDQCKVFFSKARKCLGLDSNHSSYVVESGNDEDDSDISLDKSSLECSKMDKLVENIPELREKSNADSDENSEVEGEIVKDVKYSLDLNVCEEVVTGHGDVSSRLSFRKSCDKMYESRDGFHLNLPRHSLLDCSESCQILNGNLTQTERNMKLDVSLLMDPCLPKDVEKKSTRTGNVKLFGQIITSQPPQENVEKKNGGTSTSFDLKFNESNKNVRIRSHGYWDGSKIQIGVPPIPDSARLLAKYPAAFSKTCPFLDSCSSNNGRQESVGPFMVNKYKNIGGVLDPVAALRRHYVMTEEYKNGGSDIDNR